MLSVALLLLVQAAPQDEWTKQLTEAGANERAGRREKAIAQYREIIAGLRAMETRAAKPYAYVRYRAQWQLAVCLEEERKPEEAFKAYQDAEKTPTGSWCGNAHSSAVAAAQIGQGRCLESLGRHDEAILAYYKGSQDDLNGHNGEAVRRIVDLYEAAGKTDSLKTLLARWDKEYFDQFKPESGLKVDAFEKHNPTRPIKRLLEVRDAGRLEQWGKLADVLDVHGSLRFGLMDARCLEDVVDAAHLLAARPEKTLPLMKSRLEGNPEHRSWKYYVLGLCATPEALKMLKERAEALGRLPWDEHRNWEIEDLGYALDLSEAGRAILKEFLRSGLDTLKHPAEAVYQKSTSLKKSFPEFPPLPKDLRLK